VIEAVDEYLVCKVVRDDGRDAVAFFVVERVEIGGVANFVTRDEVLREDGLIGVLAVASRAFDGPILTKVGPKSWRMLTTISGVMPSS